MRLATVFKSAVVGAGVLLSTIGGFAFSSRAHDADMAAQQGNNISSLKQEIQIGLGYDATLFFAGTTLIATGLRRKKSSEQKFY